MAGLRWLILPAAVLLLCIGVYYFVWRPASGALWGCTLQLSGTDANVTLRGWNADRICDDLASRPIALPGDPSGAGIFLQQFAVGTRCLPSLI